MRELMIFENEEFGEIRGLNIDGKPWFVGKDVAEKLGYSNPTKAVSTHCMRVSKMRVPTNRKLHTKARNEQEMSIISEDDVYRLIMKSKTKSKIYKDNFISWLTKESIIRDNIIILESREEIEFLDKLEQVLEPLGYKGTRQYNVLNKYRIDYYMPELNLAIEYDENNHNNYTYEQHEGRQKRIEKELGCKFIRVSNHNSNESNIGRIIKEIFEIERVEKLRMISK